MAIKWITLLLFSVIVIGCSSSEGVNTTIGGSLVAPSVVAQYGSNGQVSNNPMRYTATVTAGDGMVVMWQTTDLASINYNLNATSITTSNGDACHIISNSGTNGMGVGYCSALVGGSTDFWITLTTTPTGWAEFVLAEVANLNGVDCVGGPNYILDTGASGNPWSTASCTTTHNNTIMFATASDESEIALANGDVGCCVSGTYLSTGDPGGVGSYQVLTTTGTYEAWFASYAANDSAEANMFIVY